MVNVSNATLAGLSRRREEVCDYCYSERQAINAQLEGSGRHNKSWSAVTLPDLSQMECVCGPASPCRSTLCAWYKRSLGGNKEPQGESVSDEEAKAKKKSNDAASRARRAARGGS